MVLINPNTLIVTGGNQNNVYQTQCEEYDIQKNEWIRFPSLNFERAGHISYSFQQRYLYVAYGWDGKNSLASKIEKIKYGQTMWSLVPQVQDALTPTYWLYYLYMDNGNILIWGGDSSTSQE
jgi:hypothetical protein